MTRLLLAFAVVWTAFACDSAPPGNVPVVVELRPELREWCEMFIDSLPTKGADTSGIVLYVERSTDDIHFPMFKHSYWIETTGSGKEFYDTIFGQPTLRTFVQGRKIDIYTGIEAYLTRQERRAPSEDFINRLRAYEASVQWALEDIGGDISRIKDQPYHYPWVQPAPPPQRSGIIFIPPDSAELQKDYAP